MEGLISDYSRIPEDAVIINELHIVEYMTEGEIIKIDLSSSIADESGILGYDDATRLIGHAHAMNLSGFLIQEIHDATYNGDDEDDEDDGTEEEPALV